MSHARTHDLNIVNDYDQAVIRGNQCYESVFRLKPKLNEICTL